MKYCPVFAILLITSDRAGSDPVRALGPAIGGWSFQLLAWTLALMVQARSAPGPRAPGPARGQSKLRSAVGYDFLWEAVEFPDVPKVKVCCSGGGDCSDRLDEVETFAYGVDGHHDGVISARFWEF